jgi:small-conductance mechanosensitive channel
MTWQQILLRAWEGTIFRLGNVQISLASIVYIALALGLLLVLTRWVRRGIVARLLAQSNLDAGQRQAVGSIIHYLAVLLGFLVILQTAGIDVTSLNVLAGALGIGLGFGLQNIAGNFISGLIILIERPLKVGIALR